MSTRPIAGFDSGPIRAKTDDSFLDPIIVGFERGEAVNRVRLEERIRRVLRADEMYIVFPQKKKS